MTQLDIARAIASHNGNCSQFSCSGKQNDSKVTFANANVPCPWSGHRCSNLNFEEEYKKLLAMEKAKSK